ncbi:MAG: FHA domain-containing protein [Anaerolineales bacterium]
MTFKKSVEYPVLVAQTGPLNGQRIVIDGTLTIGREPSCTIIIPDRQVSRFHARLVPMPEGVMLEDMGSKNGTYCNGTLITSAVMLQDGDVVKIALVQEMMFLSSDATVPLDVPMHRPGRLVIDARSRRVLVNQQLLNPPLSAQQFQLLLTLYNSQGEVVSRPDLVAAVWGDEQSAGVSDQALDALIRRLRDRLAAVDPTHNYLVTVRGHGLRLDNPAGG